MIKIFELPQIMQVINIQNDLDELINLQKSAFMDFTAGLYNMPMPMQFVFPACRSDCHIKGGYKKNNKHFVVKIANSSPSGISGLVLVFEVQTGKIKAILSDEGFLTTLRTTIAGLIVSELVPWQIQNIGIVGSGHLAKMLHDLLSLKFPNIPLFLSARNRTKALNITNHIFDTAEELVEKCDLVFTATSSSNPILKDIDLHSQKAIVALGSDDEHKQEISLEVFGKCEFVIVDSKEQSLKLSDVARSVSAKIVSPDNLIELGNVLKFGIPKNTKRIIADFSGIGAQDVALIEFILSRLQNSPFS